MPSSLVGVAAQLRAAQAVAASTGSSTQVGSAAGAVAGALSSGRDRARGAFQSLVGEAQARANLLRGQGENASTLPSDGSVCESCGAAFGLLRRRSTCASCDRYLCASCLGNQLAGVPVVSCLCAAVCPQCRAQGVKETEFQAASSEMENGINITLGLPKKSGLFGSGSGARKLAAWFSLDATAGEFLWASLEQKNGRPAEEGNFRVCEVLAVRDTGAAIELSVKGQPQAYTLEFSTASDRQEWSRHLDLAVEVLTPESERASQEAAKASHKQQAFEERRALNEERRKKLSENLGMRYTAEAMMNRSDGPARK